jgi:hypothetical protein
MHGDAEMPKIDHRDNGIGTTASGQQQGIAERLDQFRIRLIGHSRHRTE